MSPRTRVRWRPSSWTSMPQLRLHRMQAVFCQRGRIAAAGQLRWSSRPPAWGASQFNERIHWNRSRSSLAAAVSGLAGAPSVELTPESRAPPGPAGMSDDVGRTTRHPNRLERRATRREAFRSCVGRRAIGGSTARESFERGRPRRARLDHADRNALRLRPSEHAVSLRRALVGGIEHRDATRTQRPARPVREVPRTPRPSRPAYRAPAAPHRARGPG